MNPILNVTKIMFPLKNLIISKIKSPQVTILVEMINKMDFFPLEKNDL